ncbi:hypothetical protein RDV64_20770 [Acuticoccus sp. MNP-M23]|uniref:hypothetical protein n=1 Tax=Acuticoccus sp. MNP-M23 TaxID=3072793 RepID=UPI002815CBDC|nr:hypothetical protein [Acuticoccus sp. MNP-M23]WMS42468.1 hypothetical protein RDV64_20770 [Acuticoccus sp. MNP-M23]
MTAGDGKKADPAEKPNDDKTPDAPTSTEPPEALDEAGAPEAKAPDAAENADRDAPENKAEAENAPAGQAIPVQMQMVPRSERARYESAASRIAKLRKSVNAGAAQQKDEPAEETGAAPETGTEAAAEPPPAAEAPKAAGTVPVPSQETAAPAQRPPRAKAGPAPSSGPSNAVVPVSPPKGRPTAPAKAQRPAAERTGRPAQLPATTTPPQAPRKARPAPGRVALPAPALSEPEFASPARAKSRWDLGRSRTRMSSSRAAILSMTSQEAPLEAAEEEERDALWLVQASLMRLVGVAWLAVTVLIWGRLIGYLDANLTIAWHAPEGPWLAVMVSAVLAPVVSIGLWLAASWGIVVWLAAVALGIYAFSIAPIGTVPLGIPGLAANIVGLVVVCALAGLRAWRDRDIDD